MSAAGTPGIADSHLRNLLAQAPALIAIVRGPDYVFDFVNPRFLEAVGRDDPAELIGKPLRRALPEFEEQGLFDLLDQVYASGEPYIGTEQPVRVPSGDADRTEERYYNFVWQPIRSAAGAGGQVEGIMAHAVDVTEGVRARRGMVEVATALAIERERLAIAQEAAHMGSFDWNVRTGRVVWSEELEALYGVPQDGLGSTVEEWAEHIHPADRERALAEGRRAVTEGTDLRTEFRVARPDGSERWMEARARVVCGADGQPERLIGINLDVTERKLAEAALREQTNTLVMINRIGRLLTSELDQRKLVQAVTDAATALTGAQFGAFFYNVVNAQGEAHTLYSISGVPRERFDQFPMPRSTKIFGPTFRGEAVIRLDDVTQDPRFGQNPPYHGLPPGHLPVRSYLAVPVVSRWGKVLGGLFFGHERPGVFSERAESLVIGLAAQTAVAMDNARLYQEAQDSIRVRDEFLSSAAHDLKTPLAGIKGLAQLLHRRAGRMSRMSGNEMARLEDGLESIDKAATRMTSLINDLLDVTRLHLGRPLDLERTPADLVALARHAIEAAQLTTDRHHLRLESTPPELFGMWDEHRLGRVLDNLLSNAIRYSPEGGNVTVTIWSEPGSAPEEHADQEQEWAVFSVRDEGIGIPDEDVQRVFDRFQRGRNVVGQIEGTGIGLASSRYIVENHGGEITFESREGEGTTFIVRLPIAMVPAEPQVAGEPS